MSFGDGPPYSEDEDLHSPVVTLTRQGKKPTGADIRVTDAHISDIDHVDRGTYVGTNPDGSETYYVSSGDTTEDGPGGDYVTYPVNEGRYSYYGAQQDYAPETNLQSEDENAGGERYSQDYQFAVGCPDEEMHGKAVALFDFVREHENELPLTEGQLILVSYRHGQGWLVAEDPKTGENGLVPEEFVRLLRNIEGGLTSLNGEPNLESTETNEPIEMTEDDDASTPTQNDHQGTNGDTPTNISFEGVKGAGNIVGSGGLSNAATKT